MSVSAMKAMAMAMADYMVRAKPKEPDHLMIKAFMQDRHSLEVGEELGFPYPLDAYTQVVIIETVRNTGEMVCVYAGGQFLYGWSDTALSNRTFFNMDIRDRKMRPASEAEERYTKG